VPISPREASRRSPLTIAYFMVSSHRCRERAIAGCLRTVVAFVIPMGGGLSAAYFIGPVTRSVQAFVLLLAIGWQNHSNEFALRCQHWLRTNRGAQQRQAS